MNSDLRRYNGLRLLALIFVTFAAACNDSDPEPDAGAVTSELLAQPLWIERDAYDASHNLMVPMHAAFSVADPREVDRYVEFFRTLEATGMESLVPDRFHRLQFLYFYSRFIALLASREGCSQRALSHHATVRSLWSAIVMAPAWQWDRPDFPTLFDRVRWKLDQTEVAYSYYRAITDEDLYGLAIGADLANVASQCALEEIQQYTDSLALARVIFSQEITPTAAGGWVLQKGAWTDHPDYAFAGHEQVAPDLQPAPVPGISPDSSHSFRLPLVLISFACAEEPGSAFRELFFRRTGELALQWSLRTVVMPDSSFRGVRMTNFMDGENGVYRYGYVTQGPGNGFGAYELSGSLNIGWWAFLGLAAEPVYGAQLASLPFADEVLASYVGPNTTRIRNPAFTEPAFYQGELIHEILSSALTVASRTSWCQ